MLMRSSLALSFMLAACGGSDPSTPDAQTDAAAGSVKAVACPATVPLTVDAPDGQSTMFTFTPAGPAPILVGGIVKFTMHTEHNVVPDPTATKTDPGLKVNQNATTCLEFTQTGTFGFLCGIHGFKGAITVQTTD